VKHHKRLCVAVFCFRLLMNKGHAAKHTPCACVQAAEHLPVNIVACTDRCTCGGIERTDERRARNTMGL
jgi:hypothetical protein